MYMQAPLTKFTGVRAEPRCLARRNGKAELYSMESLPHGQEKRKHGLRIVCSSLMVDSVPSAFAVGGV